MKSQFNNFQDFIGALEAVENLKEDYIANPSSMKMSDNNKLSLINYDSGSSKEYKMRPIAHEQVADKMGIPKDYYDKIGTIPYFRSTNVNTWLIHEAELKKSRKFMIRTVGDEMRALLFNGFKPFDNMIAINAILPVLKDHPDLQIMSANLSESYMYFQLRFPKLSGEVTVGDIVQAGLSVRNSEVGKASVNIRFMTWVLRCTNGQISENLLRQNHVGARIGNDENDYSVFKSDTIKAEMKAFQLKVRDILVHGLTEDIFQKKLNMMKRANDDKVENLPEVIERVTKKFKLSEDIGKGIIKNIIKEGRGANRWSIVNGITFQTHDEKNPDKAYDLERIGSDLIEIKPGEWAELNP